MCSTMVYDSEVCGLLPLTSEDASISAPFLGSTSKALPPLVCSTFPSPFHDLGILLRRVCALPSHHGRRQLVIRRDHQDAKSDPPFRPWSKFPGKNPLLVRSFSIRKRPPRGKADEDRLCGIGWKTGVDRSSVRENGADGIEGRRGSVSGGGRGGMSPRRSRCLIESIRESYR